MAVLILTLDTTILRFLKSGLLSEYSRSARADGPQNVFFKNQYLVPVLKTELYPKRVDSARLKKNMSSHYGYFPFGISIFNSEM